MQDVYGNYQASLPPVSVARSKTRFGAGAPVGVPVENEKTYINTANGNVYENINGTWTLVTAGIPVAPVTLMG